MSSISIDHTGISTWALTSIVFDHIVDTRQTSQETREMCPVYHRNTQHYWWGYKPNLILEENDVTHHVKKRKIKCLHVFHYFQTQSNSSFFKIKKNGLKAGTRTISARYERKTQRLVATRGPCRSTSILMYTNVYAYPLFFLPVSRCVYMIYICILQYRHIYVNICVHQHVQCAI